MAYQKIIIGIGILMGFLLLPQTKSILLRGILIGFVISFGLTFFTKLVLINLSFFSFGILVLAFLIHQAVNRKWTNLFIGFFAFLLFLWNFFYWNFIGELRFIMIIPILIYVWTLIRKPKSKKELSILTILVFYELSEFLTLVEKWI